MAIAIANANAPGAGADGADAETARAMAVTTLAVLPKPRTALQPRLRAKKSPAMERTHLRTVPNARTVHADRAAEAREELARVVAIADDQDPNATSREVERSRVEAVAMIDAIDGHAVPASAP